MARFRQDTKVLALKRSPLFEGLANKQLATLARLTDDLEVPAGTVLCREGKSGREFFVIIDGEAEVTRGGKHVATIGSGEFFGEIALLERVVRTATVTAKTPLRFFVLTSQAFWGLLDHQPEIQREVLRALARRVASESSDPTA